MTTVDRDSITLGEMFDAMTSVLVRLERMEEVVVLIAGVMLFHDGKIRHPSEHGTIEGAYAEMADYMLIIQEERDKMRVVSSFLDSPE